MPLAKAFSNHNLFYKIASYVLFFAVSAAAYNGYRDKAGFENNNAESAPSPGSNAVWEKPFIEMVLDGEMSRPFVFRRMVPFIANTVNAMVPERIQDKLYNAKNSQGVLLHEKFSSSIVERNRVYFLRYWVLNAIEVLAYFLTTLCCFRFCLLAGFSKHVSLIATMSFMIMVPFFMDCGKEYDAPEMLFFFVSAILALRGRWIWLLPLAALATANKESYLLFIPLLYPFLRRYMTAASSMIRLGLVAIPSVLVNIYVHWAYRFSPGENAGHYFGRQLRSIPDLFKMAHPHATYGIILPPTENIFTILFAVWAIWLAWSYISVPLRQHFQLALLINIPLFIVLGNPMEIRTLSMLYISCVVLLATHIERWCGLGGSGFSQSADVS